MKRAAALGATGLVLACVLGWFADARAMLASYLAAWWFVTGALLGGLANVWLHDLTGGAWGKTIRGPLLLAARWLPLACLLFLPVLAALPLLYPWAAPGSEGMARWRGDFSAPQFKNMWLAPGFFVARSVAYLLVWSVLACLSVRRGERRSRGAAAASLLAYAFTCGLAAVDWIMSLQPAWYSSVFGWLAGTGQMLSGLALAILLIDREAARKVLPDLGNLLLMYVMTWAYLAYVQFLIIWAANLPHEIGWYLRRSMLPWKAIAWMLAVFHGAGPLLILLSRRAKRAPRLLGALAGALLLAHLVDCWWLVLPSLDGLSWHAAWLAPLVAAGFCLAAWPLLKVKGPVPREEVAHA
jgi:hypothetical protein